MDSNSIVSTDTWLNTHFFSGQCYCVQEAKSIPARTTDKSTKTRGGDSCIYMNKAWCTEFVIAKRYCSPNVEFLLVKMQTLLASSSSHIRHSTTPDSVISHCTRRAKHWHRLEVGEQFPNSSPWRLWQGIQFVNDYRPLVLSNQYLHSWINDYCPVGLTPIIRASVFQTASSGTNQILHRF